MNCRVVPRIELHMLYDSSIMIDPDEVTDRVKIVMHGMRRGRAMRACVRVSQAARVARQMS